METFLKNHTSLSVINFNEIAEKILNQSCLMINDSPCRICEIEFYYYSNDHCDSYTHAHLDQLHWSKWYFHRFNNGTYKNGHYKGVDISIGDGKDSRGGILIRSIYDPIDNIFIEGPCKVVNHILEKYLVNSISEFVDNQMLSVIENQYNLILKDCEPGENQEKIFIGRRIGLSDKYPEFRDLKYRYVIGPVKKEKRSLQVLN